MRVVSAPRVIVCSLLAGASLGLGVVPALGISSSKAPGEVPIPHLTEGQVLEREMAAGETHRYSIDLRAGQYLQIVVEQHGADVIQTLTAPDGSVVLETDSPCQSIGPDPLAVIAAQTGAYGLSLKADPVSSSPRGRYEIRVEAIREPSPLDLVRVGAVRANAEGRPLFRADPRVALERYRAALQGWVEVGDRRMQMWTELVVGVLHAQGSDDYKEALEHYRRPLATALEIRDEWAEARVRFNIGQSLRYLGELDEARAHLERALALNRAAGRDDSTARVLSSLGDSFALAGEPQRALDTQFEALRIFQALGNTRSEAVTRTSIGNIYLRLRDPELALEQYALALPVFAREPPYRATTIARAAKAHAQMGDMTRAREAYTEALGIYQTTGNRIYEADTYLGLGELHQEEGDLRAASELFASALHVYRSRGYPLGEGLTQCRLGEVHSQLGALEAARVAFEAALAVAPRASPFVSACAEAGLARVARDAGDLGAARAYAESALARAESLRARVVSHHARSATLASQQSLYQLLIDVLMRQHALLPREGRDIAAFEVSERARARSLLELLAEGQVDVRQGVDPALLAEEQSLRRGLNAKAQEEAQALVAGRPQRAEALGREADGLLARLAETEARIRGSSPHYAALTQPQPLTLPEIRAHVLDPDTQLLEYTLGDPRSYLWVVSSARLESFALAPRAEIERAARRVLGLVSVPAAKTGGPAEPGARETALGELSRLLLAPAAEALTGKRLLVVAPGALQYVPFACLPLPDAAVLSGASAGAAAASGAPPLVSRFELVSAPSASVIATLRREWRERSRATKTAAVFADPVFEASDPRLAAALRSRSGAAPVAVASRGTEAESLPERALRAVGGTNGGLGRLPFSRQEAEGIVALASPRLALKATGFEASRGAVTSAPLADYRIVHFATHGVLNTRRPELSGVVLSLLDQAGQRQDGFLRLHDVYNLELAADLVVLSGCQTALGKDLGGEGFIGLTRGFMYAGARGVVASLWQVDDESTAELMRRFYRLMLKEGRRPADALRLAQMELSRDRRWAAPFFWAGFVLQGDWSHGDAEERRGRGYPDGRRSTAASPPALRS